MTKKQIGLLVVLIFFAGYLCLFTDWFASEGIQITHTVRGASAATRPRPGAQNLGRPVSPVAFTLNRKCRLTELKVVNTAELATNKYTQPLWHLVTKSASAPTKGFVYGGFIRGMKPSVPNAEADSLEPNVTYRLLLRAGDQKAEYDFSLPLNRTSRR